MERTRCLMVLVFVLVFGLTAGTANAKLIAVEEFDYVDGELLLGQDGGTGWAEAWGPGLENEDKFTIEPNSLIHPTITMPPAVGSHILGGYISEAMLDRSIVASEKIENEEGNVVWISYLYQVDTAPVKDTTTQVGNWRDLDLFGGPSGWSGYYACTGQPWSSERFAILELDTWKLYHSDKEIVPREVNVNSIYWVVLKTEFLGGGKAEVHMWVDPYPGTQPDPDNTLVSAINADADFGFRRIMLISVDGGRFDRIRIADTWVDCFGFSPKLAAEPRPQNLQIHVDPNLLEDDLQGKIWWAAPTDVHSPDPNYDVYFGTDPTVADNPKILDNIFNVLSVDPQVGPLDMNTQYYWRVDVHDANGGVPPEGFLREGYTWTFRTWPTTPIFKMHPEDMLINPGGDAVFTAESGGNLASIHTYEWYHRIRLGDPIGSALVNNGRFSGATTETLTVKDCQYTDDVDNDEGYYLCRATNAFGSTNSEPAGLMVMRLIAWYKFNYNFRNEVSIQGEHGLGSGKPTALTGPGYLNGIDGAAASFDGVDDYVNVPYILAETAGKLQDFTVSAWVSPDSGEDEGAILAFYDDTGGELSRGQGLFCMERQADGTVAVRVYQNNPEKMYVANAIPASVQEVQTSTLNAVMTAGTFTMTYDSETTSNIDWNASATQITTALEALTAIWPDDITVQAGHEPDMDTTCTWTFAERLGDAELLSMDISGATGPTSVDFVETTKGEDNWTHVAFVYDSNSVVGTGTLYINGEQAGHVKYDTASALKIGPFNMGAYIPEDGPGRWHFDGRMDDVRIYAYGPPMLTAVNIASLYNDMTSNPACAGNPGADTDDSCTVELKDYAKALSNWLECNIVPPGNCL